MRFTIIFTAAAAAAVTACGDSSEPGGSQSATESAAEASIDPNNPFAQAESEMNQRMMKAAGADVDDTWVKQMIEHHRGAIEMAQIALAANPSEHVRHMAQETIRKQTAEIEELNQLLSDAPTDPESIETYHPVHQAMSQAMRTPAGETVEQTFMRKMLAHHRGGVALTDVVLAEGGNARVREQAQRTRSEQENEARMVEEMLAGTPMTSSSAAAAGASPTAPPTQSATSSPATTPRARPTASPTPSGVGAAAPEGEPAPAPAAPADPHAGHDMSGGD